MAWLTTDELKALGFKAIGREVKISRHAHILGAENITIGDNVRIDIGARLFAATGRLTIGSHVHIATGALLLCGGGVWVCSGCAISFDCKLISASDSFSGEWLIGPVFRSDLTRVKKAPIVMQRLSILGSGCTILPGVTMAEGSVAGANTLLLKNTAPWRQYVGSPAVESPMKRSRKAHELFERWEREWKA